MNKILEFTKKNIVYFVIALCVLAIGLSVLLVALSDKPPKKQASVDPTGPETQEVIEDDDDTLKFVMPVQNILGIKEYNEIPVFSSTLGIYTNHKAIDFYAVEGSPVFAVADGKVEKIENSLLEGVKITVSHKNGLTSVYGSLLDSDSVFEGQQVKAGEVIGALSVTNRQEYKDGAHLHFQMFENGAVVNPENYITIIEK